MKSDSTQIYKPNQVSNQPKNAQQNVITNQLENASGLDHIKTLFNVPVNIFKKNGGENHVLNQVEQNLSFIYSNDLSEQWLIEPDMQSDGFLILQSVKDRVQHKGLTITPQNGGRYELRWSQNGEQISISDVIISKHSLKEDQFQKTQFSMIELMNMSDDEENQLIKQELPANKTKQRLTELKSLDSFIQDIRDLNPPVAPTYDFLNKVVVIQKDEKLLTVTETIEFMHSLEFCKQSQWIIHLKDQSLVARSVYEQKAEYELTTEQVIKKSYNCWQLSDETIKIVDAKLSSGFEKLLNYRIDDESKTYLQKQKKLEQKLQALAQTKLQNQKKLKQKQLEQKLQALAQALAQTKLQNQKKLEQKQLEQKLQALAQTKIIPFELEGQVIQICKFEDNKFATVHRRRNTKSEHKTCPEHEFKKQELCVCSQTKLICNLCGLCKSCALRQQILEEQNFNPKIEDGIWINLWCYEDMAYCQDSFGLSSVVAPDETNILLQGNGLFYFKKTEQIQIINLITKEVVVSFYNSNEIYSLLETKLKKPDIMKELKPQQDFPVNQLVLMSNNQILKIGDKEDSIFIDLLKATQIAKLPGVVIKQTTREMYLLHDRNLFVYPYSDRQIDKWTNKYVLDLDLRLTESIRNHQIKQCDSDKIQFYAKVESFWYFYTLSLDKSGVNINQCLSNLDKQKSVVLNKNLCYIYDFWNTKQVNGFDQIEIEQGDDKLFSNNKRLPIYEVLNTFVVSDKPKILIFYADDKGQTHYCIIECQKDKDKKSTIWEPPRAISNYFVGEDYIVYKSDFSNEIIVQNLFNLQDKQSFLFDECFMKIGKHMAPNLYEPLVLTKENEIFRCKSGFQLENIFQFELSKNKEFEFHAGQIKDLILLHDYLLVQLESNLFYLDPKKNMPKIEQVSTNKFPQQKLVLSNKGIYYFEIEQTNSYIRQIFVGEKLENKIIYSLPEQIISIQLGLKDELLVLTHNFQIIVIENGVGKNYSIPQGTTESVLVLSQNYLLDLDNLMNLSNNNKNQIALPKGNQQIIFVENIFQEHLFVTSNQTEGSFILQQHCCTRNIGLNSRFKNDNEKIQIFSTESCLIKYKEIKHKVNFHMDRFPNSYQNKTIYFYDKNSFKLIGSSILPETTTKVQIIDQLLLREDSEITKSFLDNQNLIRNGWSCIKIYKNQQSLEFDLNPREYEKLLGEAEYLRKNCYSQYLERPSSFPSFFHKNSQLFCFMKTKFQIESDIKIVKILGYRIYLLNDKCDNFLITEKFVTSFQPDRGLIYISFTDIPGCDQDGSFYGQQKFRIQDIPIKDDFRISRANESDLKLIQKWDKPKQNVISIQNSKVCILWDLESNTEISCISYHSQLYEPCNYVDTGFNTLRDQHYLIKNEVSIFQTYSIANLMELINISRLIEEAEGFALDEETIFAIYGNQNFFNMIWDFSQYSTFKEHNQSYFEELLILIFDWLKQIILDQDILNQQQTNKMDNIFVRRLFYLLNNTIMPFDSEELIRFDVKEGRPNLLQWAIIQRSIILEPLLNLLAYSSEFQFEDVVGSQFLFEEIDQIKSSTLQKLIQTNLTVRNPKAPTKILVPWNDQFQFITLPMSHSFLDKEGIKSLLSTTQQQQRTWVEKCKNKKMRSFNVDIRIIDINWLQNENYSKFFKYLVKEVEPDDRLYFQRNIVQYLVDYESRNILRQLLPILTTNVIFTVLNLIYLNKFIFMKEISNQAIFVGSFIIMTATLMCFVEYYQIYTQRLSYINFWNIVQLSLYILSITVVIQHLLFGRDQATLLQVASVTSFLNWLTVFYWLRLLPQFSYYVKMISQAVDDIKYFLLMLLIIIIAFSNANFILLQIGSEQKNLSTLYISTLLRQYNIVFTIGDSFTPNDENDTPTLVLMDILSVASTLITTTVFLNIFIGIIGTTLSKVSEINHFVTLREQVQLYHDYEKIIRLFSKTHWLQGKKYLYVLTPSIDEDQLDKTSEKIQAILESCNQLQQNFEKVYEIKKIKNEVKMELNDVTKTNHENQKLNKNQVKGMKNEIVGIVGSIPQNDFNCSDYLFCCCSSGSYL